MTDRTRHGVIVFDDEAIPGRATVRISLDDVRRADASAVRLADTVLDDVDIEPGGELLFEIRADVSAFGAGVIVRVHVDYSGDRQLAVDDQYSTVSIPASVLGDSPRSAGRVPVARI